MTASSPSAPDYDVAVIGAGVAGLLTALRHAEAGHRTIVLEASAEPGGCVRFHEVAGLRLDRGAESFATARPAVGELVAELGLPVERPAAGPAWIHHRRGRAPMPAATLFGIPAHPAAPDVRRLVGWPGVARAHLDRLLPRRLVPSGLGELVELRMGRRVVDRLLRPVVAGVYAADPAGLDIDAVTPGLRSAIAATGSLQAAVARLRGDGAPAGSAVAGITGGMARLTTALVDRLGAAGGTLRCDAEVRDLQRNDGCWEVRCGPDGVVAARARTVVVAVPGPAAAPLVAAATGGDVTLPVTPATPVLVVTLVVDAAALDRAPRGTGVLVAPDATDVTAKALTHATAKWAWLARAAGPHRHVLRLSYGRGDTLPEPAEFPDLALADASRLLGTRLTLAALVDYAAVRYPDRLAVRRTDQRAQRARFEQDLARHPGLAVRGSAVAGTGLAAVVANATAADLA